MITVIVMIILAGSVIISLSNSGIIGKANEAVDANNLKQVQQLASLAWSEAYIEKMTDSTVDLEAKVKEALEKNKVSLDKYAVSVKDNGVEVYEAKLGSLVKSAADYGKTVDYTVTVGVNDYDIDGNDTVVDVTISDWQVLYEDKANGYVFLISEDIVQMKTFEFGTSSVESLDSSERALYRKFQVGNFDKLSLAENDENGWSWISQNAVAWLIESYNVSSAPYEDYVVGIIGAPTIELIVANQNEGLGTNKFSLSITSNDELKDWTGYKLMANNYMIEKNTGVYNETAYWVASPQDNYYTYLFKAGNSLDGQGDTGDGGVYDTLGIRPVICLKSDIPAKIGTTTDFSIVK